LVDVRSQTQSKETSAAASEVLLNKPALTDSPKPRKKDLSSTTVDSKPEIPMSDEDISIQENGKLPSRVEDSDKDDNTFNKSSPSPQVPCPYIDFVPLKEESPARKTKEEESKDSRDAESNESKAVETRLETEEERGNDGKDKSAVEKKEEKNGKRDGGVVDEDETKRDSDSGDLEAKDEKESERKNEEGEEEKTQVDGEGE